MKNKSLTKRIFLALAVTVMAVSLEYGITNARVLYESWKNTSLYISVEPESWEQEERLISELSENPYVSDVEFYMYKTLSGGNICAPAAYYLNTIEFYNDFRSAMEENRVLSFYRGHEKEFFNYVSNGNSEYRIVGYDNMSGYKRSVNKPTEVEFTAKDISNGEFVCFVEQDNYLMINDKDYGNNLILLDYYCSDGRVNEIVPYNFQIVGDFSKSKVVDGPAIIVPASTLMRIHNDQIKRSEGISETHDECSIYDEIDATNKKINPGKIIVTVDNNKCLKIIKNNLKQENVSMITSRELFIRDMARTIIGLAVSILVTISTVVLLINCLRRINGIHAVICICVGIVIGTVVYKMLISNENLSVFTDFKQIINNADYYDSLTKIKIISFISTLIK